MPFEDRFFVVTGGPGSGKTTLLTQLKNAGYVCMPEAGRAIIQDQVAIGGTALPWANREAFAELMLGWEMRSYREASLQGTAAIFDRGVPDVLGYLRLNGLPVPAHVEQAAKTFRYHRQVFLAPYWPEIFAQDTERKQTASEAKRTCEVLAETYVSLGYELIALPMTSVGERLRFITGYLPEPRRDGT